MFSRAARFWILIALLAANLAVGVLSLFFLRAVNERYALLFERSIPVVNNLRTLTRELGFVQRLARRIVDPENEPAWRELIPQMNDASAKARSHALVISNAELFQDAPHRAAIAEGSREYDALAQAFLRLVAEGKIAEAHVYNNEVLRPGYDNFQLTLDAAADFVESQGSNLRDRYVDESRFFGGLLLAFAGWPVLAAGLGMAVLGVLIVTLLIALFAPDWGWGRRVARKRVVPS